MPIGDLGQWLGDQLQLAQPEDARAEKEVTSKGV
jgi:hypothetical protein